MAGLEVDDKRNPTFNRASNWLNTVMTADGTGLAMMANVCMGPDSTSVEGFIACNTTAGSAGGNFAQVVDNGNDGTYTATLSSTIAGSDPPLCEMPGRQTGRLARNTLGTVAARWLFSCRVYAARCAAAANTAQPASALPAVVSSVAPIAVMAAPRKRMPRLVDRPAGEVSAHALLAVAHRRFGSLAPGRLCVRNGRLRVPDRTPRRFPALSP